jgi:Flp pilus assembly protein CpaB
MNQFRPQLRLRRSTLTPEIDGRPPQLAPPPARARRRSPGGVLRRLAQPLPLIGIVLLLIAAAGYAAVAASTRARSDRVVVAARYLPAGSRISGRDLRVAKLSGNDNLLRQLIPASAEGSLLGRRLAAPVLAGLPIGRAALAAPNGGPAAFTLTVPALHALGGNLAVGDRVSVLATFTNQAGGATARVIARNLVVLGVGAPPTGIDQASTTVPVTVALPNPSLASQLALANSVAKLDLLRDGSNTTSAIPSANVTGAAAGAGGTP